MVSFRYGNKRQASGSKINLFYSTPSCYLKSLHDANIKWPTKSDDFFPYASDPHSFWTGYFTSRPTIKRFERIGNHFLQVCKQLTALTPRPDAAATDNLNELREAMGVMQHHDAVTGTEKQLVADDYMFLLYRAMENCQNNAEHALNQLSNEETNPNLKINYKSCLGLNVSSCSVSEDSDKFIVTLYNPLAHSKFEYVRVPVAYSKYSVMDYRNVAVASQLIPIPDSLMTIPSRKSQATHELVFLANEIPPLGYKSYFVERVKSQLDDFQSDQPAVIDSESDEVKERVSIGNNLIQVNFGENGLLSSISGNGIDLPIEQNFFIYEAAAGDNREFKNRSSGAYIFRPNVTQAIRVNSKAEIRVIKKPDVEEVHQKFNEWISQVVRVYKAETIVEIEWLVGEIPVADNIGREIITRFDTTIQSSGVFFTDSNGREMLKRKRDHRDTWNLVLLEKIAGNYYPVTSKIAIEDSKSRLAILNDRAQGGSSLRDGSIELMVSEKMSEVRKMVDIA